MVYKIEDVVRDKIPFDRSGFLDETEFDRIWVSLSAFYIPSRNRQTFEMVLPRFRNQMLNDSYDFIKDSYKYSNWHRLSYKKVDNLEFHKFLRKHKTDKFRMFNEETRVWKTNYYSTELRLRGMPYDYEGLLITYGGFPKRKYFRRAPCTELVGTPKRIEKMENAISNYCDGSIGSSSLEDFFFLKMGKPNGLRIAYTNERKFEFKYSSKIEVPAYYILDMDNNYFKDGIISFQSWKSSIVKRRISTSEEFYITSFEKLKNLKLLGHYCAWGEDLYLYTENKESVKSFSNNFSSIAEHDMKMITDRHSWHKFSYNEFAMRKSGFYCPLMSSASEGDIVISEDGELVDGRDGVSFSDKGMLTTFTPIKGKDGISPINSYVETPNGTPM